MNQTQANRLAAMCEFVENRPAKKLDMDHIVLDGQCQTAKQVQQEMSEEKCGTAGCLAGSLPLLFPRMFHYVHPVLIEGYHYDKKYEQQWLVARCCVGVDFPEDYDILLSEAFGITADEGDELGRPTYKPAEKSKQIVINRMYALADQYGYDISGKA